MGKEKKEKQEQEGRWDLGSRLVQPARWRHCQIAFPPLIPRTTGAFAIFWPDASSTPPVTLQNVPHVSHSSAGLQPAYTSPPMSISSIESVLQQMRALAPSLGAAPALGSSEMAVGGFAGELQKSLARISGAQAHAADQGEAFEVGKSGVALNDVMVDLQKANIAFQTGLQVRNKVVAAYQEIMNMQA